MAFNHSVFKEAISIIRVLQLPIVLIGLIPPFLFKADLSFNVLCPNAQEYHIEESYKFPLNLRNSTIQSNPCHFNSTLLTLMNRDYSWYIIAFVTTMGVIGIYVILCLIMYCWFWYGEEKNKKSWLALTDLGINLVAVGVTCWITAVWTVQIVDFYHVTGKSYIEEELKRIDVCGPKVSLCDFNYDKKWDLGLLYATPVAGFVSALLNLICGAFILQHVALRPRKENKVEQPPPPQAAYYPKKEKPIKLSAEDLPKTKGPYENPRVHPTHPTAPPIYETIDRRGRDHPVRIYSKDDQQSPVWGY